jgi:uncharacterized protein
VADLYTRLKELKKRREAASPADEITAGDPASRSPGDSASDTAGDPGSGRISDPSPGPAWWRVAPGVWESESVHSLPGIIGPRIEPLIGPWSGMRPVMLDVETSGLSGGAGSTAFLIGLGFPLGPDEAEPRGVLVRQLFLSEPAAEAAMLDRFAEILGDPGTVLYVTYNGASFDLPVLRTRHILNRRRFPEGAHWDLLPLTRRFYAPAIGSCTLGRVEQYVLGLHREHDIPGSEVPGRYHRFIDSGDPEIIGDVVAHHSYDVAHLGRLAWTLNRVVAGETGSDGSAENRADGFALARYLMERGGEDALPRCARLLDGVISETAERRRLVRRAAAGFAGKVRTGLAPSRRWIVSRRLRAVVARRLGDVATEVALRRELFEQSGTREELEEYAKVLEHRLGDYAGAIGAIREWAGSRAGESDGVAAIGEEGLRRRLRRLERRSERRLERQAPTEEHSADRAPHTPPPSGSS